MSAGISVAVIIPCYRVTAHILTVLGDIPEQVDAIYVVDDACPDGSGDFVSANAHDPRIKVVKHAENRGVGGATLTGFRAAAADGARVLVKLDGDGQMLPGMIPSLIEPILQQRADYTKGNRFFDLESVREMPPVRLFGNAALSFLTKLSTGYWQVFDPTNGFVAMDARLFRMLPVEKIHPRYFFESDLLFRLSTFRAVVVDIPMQARYRDEESGLKVRSVLFPFLLGHVRNTFKRVLYGYFLRDFSMASVNLVAGLGLVASGLALGIYKWWDLAGTGQLASSGTVMLSALQIILGFQLLLSALSFDFQNAPKDPVSKYLQ